MKGQAEERMHISDAEDKSLSSVAFGKYGDQQDIGCV